MKERTEIVRGWMSKEQLDALVRRMLVVKVLCRIEGLDFDTMTPEELDRLIDKYSEE